MDEGAAECLAQQLNALRLGLNTQRELVHFAREIAARDGMSVPEVFARPDIREILGGENADRAHKARRLRAVLRRQRYPHLSEAERWMREKIVHLDLPKGLLLKPPPHFEGTVFTLELSFRNLSELADRHAAVGDLVDNPSMKTILEPYPSEPII
jgi:hypothetical protein